MSIQTDLTRIKNAKAAIKAAIEGKGVTVPDATLLDGMAALIESIEAGGGGGDISPFFRIGTYIPSEDQTKTVFKIISEEELFNIYSDSKSIFLLWYNSVDPLITNGSYMVLFANSNVGGHCYSYGIRPSGSVYNTNTSSNMDVKFTRISPYEIDVTVKGNTTANFTYGLVSGVEYGWGFIYKG